MDHIFLVEKRHTQRIQREIPLAQVTGVAEGDTPALFDFGRAERAGFEGLVNSIRPDEAAQVRDFEMAGAVYRVTPRKLIFHTLIHEVRHGAQIATALRNAGFDPPGQHDLLFTNTLERCGPPARQRVPQQMCRRRWPTPGRANVPVSGLFPTA